MRIDRLELLRYGCFSDRCIELPAGAPDLHILVGANEAGKSTLRNAIADLLYGIEHLTRYAFRHPMPELRLGARLSHAGQALALVRRKGQRQTLLTPDGQALPDAVLAPYLGGSDRPFFERMFGLDQARLVRGGAELLSASDDLGQLLFRSAAGLSGLGDVARRLEQEADALWGPRKRGDRACQAAADALEAAEAELKACTVKASDWARAQAEHDAALASFEQCKARQDRLRARKRMLERIRRTRPGLQALQQADAALAALGPVAALPEAARQTLAEARSTAALCAVEIDQHRQTLQGLDQALRAVELEPALLAAAAEIEDLHTRRLLCAGHPAAIQLAQGVIDAEWARAMTLARQLGWAADSEPLLRQRLPALAHRSRLQTLLAQHATLELALRHAGDQLQTRQRETEALQQRLDALGAIDAPPGLARELAQAQRLGDVEARTRALQQALAAAQRDVDRAGAALRLGERVFTDERSLQAVQLPGDEQARQHLADDQADAADERASAAALAEYAAQCERLELEIAQYRDAHRTVDADELAAARGARDGLWQQLVQAPHTLPGEAPRFEALLHEADRLADLRHATAHQASTLQEKRHRLQELQQRQARLQASHLERQQARAARALAWAALVAAAGAPGLAPEALSEWRQQRSTALAAHAAVAAARQALADHQAALADARQQLQDLLPGADGAPLGALIDRAEDLQRRADSARGSRQALAGQLDSARLALLPAAQALDTARAGLQAWQARWTQALADAMLPGEAALDAVGGLLAGCAGIDAALNAIQAARDERIAPRRAELETLATLAQALASRLAPALAGHEAAEVATRLHDRLAAARAAATEGQRLQAERQQAQARLAAAVARQQSAAATLQPLRLQAGVSDDAALDRAIDASDRQRALHAERMQAAAALRAAGDGLDLAELQAEAASADAVQLMSELDALTTEEAALADEASALAVRRERARQALDAVGGSSAAAEAEARRQEALAAMADAVERYVELTTAARLLRWALERFRETRQGPMLAAASRHFEGLTQGSFERLVVDFEHDPPLLEGRRRDGTRVGVAGLSDGSRDQLFLALRLAALELHLEAGHALPFIADDLFVNFDDARAGAGFQALGALARRTQVIYLTHHRHLAGVARQALGDAARVVEL